MWEYQQEQNEPSNGQQMKLGSCLKYKHLVKFNEQVQMYIKQVM
jgi:hypothetical protein